MYPTCANPHGDKDPLFLRNLMKETLLRGVDTLCNTKREVSGFALVLSQSIRLSPFAIFYPLLPLSPPTCVTKEEGRDWIWVKIKIVLCN